MQESNNEEFLEQLGKETQHSLSGWGFSWDYSLVKVSSTCVLSIPPNLVPCRVKQVWYDNGSGVFNSGVSNLAQESHIAA